MLKGFKKKIKSINNKMATNTYQQLNLKNKQSKQDDRDRIRDMESVSMVARWNKGVGEWEKR